MIAPLLTAITTIFSGWVDRKNRIAEAKTQAQIENAGKVIDQAGWKDEFIVLIWSIPAIMAFIPGGSEHAQAGFENLAKAPEWYILGWVSISLAVYGLKPATQKILEWRNGKQDAS